MKVILPKRHSFGIQFNKNKQKDGEAPKPGSSVTEEREWNSNGGKDPYYHPYINQEMHKEYSYQAVAVNPVKSGFLPFCKEEQANH